MIELKPNPLTSESFVDFGEVISLDRAKQIPINQGLTTRYHDLFTIDTDAENGKTIVNVFRTSPLPLPHHVKIMERHPLGSQAFLPMDPTPFLVLVADPVKKILPEHLHLFVTNGCQGINLYRNTWHHFQIGHGETRDFIVIDRGGTGDNLQELDIDPGVIIPAEAITNL